MELTTLLVRDVLARIEAMPFASLDGILGSGATLILAPHPDDETLGCGGLIAAACAQGRHVEVVVVTDGSKSHPNSIEFPSRRLVALRRTESERAAAALGLEPARVHHLGLADTAAPTRGPAFDACATSIADLVARAGADTLLVTWGRDPHCDHEAVALVAEAVAARTGARLWFYPIWSLHLPHTAELEEVDVEGVRFDIRTWLEAKRAAVMCHASQMTDLIDDDPDGFRFADATLAPFLAPYERFISARR